MRSSFHGPPSFIARSLPPFPLFAVFTACISFPSVFSISLAPGRASSLLAGERNKNLPPPIAFPPVSNRVGYEFPMGPERFFSSFALPLFKRPRVSASITPLVATLPLIVISRIPVLPLYRCSAVLCETGPLFIFSPKGEFSFPS